MQQYCNKRVEDRGTIETGGYALTPAFNLTQFKRIAHLVGPIYQESKRDLQVSQLYNGIYGLLMMCENYEYKSIAIPAISAGIYGFPKDLCAQTIIKAVNAFQQH